MPILAWIMTGFVLIMLTINSNSLFFLITGLLAGFLVLPFWLVLLCLKVELSSWPAESCSGDPLPLVLKLANHWPLPLLNLEVELKLLNPQRQALSKFSLHLDVQARKHQELSWTAGPLPRGNYQLVGLQIKGHDPFGLLSWTRLLPLNGSLRVYPALLKLVPRTLISGYTGEGLIGSRPQQHGMLPDGVRNYTPGDSLARIHWKATANQGNLVSKAFSAELANTKVLVLAYGDEGVENEAMITAGASLAWAWFQQEQEFYTLLDAEQPSELSLIRSSEALRIWLEQLILARPKARATNSAGLAQLLTEALPAGSGQLILLTNQPELSFPPNYLLASWELVVVTVNPEFTSAQIVQSIEGVG